MATRHSRYHRRRLKYRRRHRGLRLEYLFIWLAVVGLGTFLFYLPRFLGRIQMLLG